MPLLSLPQRLSRWSQSWLVALPAALSTLPGAGQRRRTLLAAVLAALALVLRPWPPFLWLPGWCVGGLLLWALVELLGCVFRPRRWR